MEGTLHPRQLIPPLTAQTEDGKQIHAWDYKQKRNLVIAFLHSDCGSCTDWLTELAAHAPELAEREAVALVIYSKFPARPATPLPSPMIAAADMSGRSQNAYLGQGAFGSEGLERVGTFVADRFGEIYEHWTGHECRALAALADLFAALWQIQIACEECGTPYWPLEG